MQKAIELTPDDFTKLIKELDECKKDKEKLQKAVNYLNNEIKKYNEKFAKGEKSEN